MSDRESNFETHRRRIKNVTEDMRTERPVDRAFRRATSGDDPAEVHEYKGVCPVCKKPIREGYAVRCSVDRDGCNDTLFHQSCFGTHTMRVHMPDSVTVIVKSATDDIEDDYWKYVDMDIERQSIRAPTKDVPSTADYEDDGNRNTTRHRMGANTTHLKATTEPNINVPEGREMPDLPEPDDSPRQKRARVTRARSRGRSVKKTLDSEE